MHNDSRFFGAIADLPTPFVIFDLEQVRRNYHEIVQAFPGVSVHYAIKANAEGRILSLLNALGAGYEIASRYEAELLIDLMIAPQRIICMHPIKSPDFLQYLESHQIRVMAVDSCEEVEKIARYAPSAQLVLRIDIDEAHGSGGLWNLNGKLGVAMPDIPGLLDCIRHHNLQLYGLTFHVGSQCETPESWIKALRACGEVWRQAVQCGFTPEFLSLGGGLPAHYRREVPTKAEIGQLVMQEISAQFGTQTANLRLAIEPGRSVVADAGILVAGVFGLATRGTRKWAYIETGTYNGLVEAIETDDRQFFPLMVEHNERTPMRYNIGGPTCVTLDTPFEDVELPELRVGDKLCILGAGAYTMVCAAQFNGFPAPAVHYWQDVLQDSPPPPPMLSSAPTPVPLMNGHAPITAPQV